MSTPGPEHQRLNPFVGQWQTEGILLAAHGEQSQGIKGTDTYQWLPGGFFLLHTADVLMGNERSQTTEIIGPDPVEGDYFMQYYNQAGESGKMMASCKGDTWIFRSEELRFKGCFSEQGHVFSGLWEQRHQGNIWKPFIEIKLRKLK